MRSTSLALFFLLLCSAAMATTPHFNECATLTGETATVVIGAESIPLVNGLPLQPGDELAVFTPDGLCAGMTTWSGNSAAIAVWANDPGSDQTDGFVVGEALSFRAFSGGVVHGGDGSSVSVAFNPNFQSGTFAVDAIYVIDELTFGQSSGNEHGVPDSFELQPSFPNPFTTRTTLRFSLPYAAGVRLEVFDLLGRRVATVVDEELAPGTYERAFEPSAGMASGQYVARLQAGKEQAHIRVTLLR